MNYQAEILCIIAELIEKRHCATATAVQEDFQGCHSEESYRKLYENCKGLV